MNYNNAKKEKRQKANQLPTTHYTVNKSSSNPTLLKTGRFALFSKPVNKYGKEWVVLTTSGTYT